MNSDANVREAQTTLYNLQDEKNKAQFELDAAKDLLAQDKETQKDLQQKIEEEKVAIGTPNRYWSFFPLI